MNSLKKPHAIQIALPDTILDFFKTNYSVGQVFELRTEAIIEGTRYRAHPNFRGGGPWYDFVKIEFELDDPLDCQIYVNDNLQYPAKLLAFFCLLSEDGEVDTEFEVLSHCSEFQRIDSDVYRRKSLLQRSWLFEVTPGQIPRPRYQITGSVKSHVCVKEHIFAIEETPGFHGRYTTEAEKRFMVLSNMRTIWPQIFIKGNPVGS